jgi:dGTPase
MGIELDDVMKADLMNFEGNAQALRILAKCRFKGEKFTDLNVTYAVMNTLIKYPNSSLIFVDKEDGVSGKDHADDVKKHKNGYYHAERDVIKKICSNCSEEDKGTGTCVGEEDYLRHPLVYIMEAADDISYCISDLEDAASKGFFTMDAFIKHYKDAINAYAKNMQCPQEAKEEMQRKVRMSYGIIGGLEKAFRSAKSRGTESDFQIFETWAAGLRNGLMHGAAYTFVKNYEEIMAGSYKYDLFKDALIEPTLGILKETMKKFVYDHPSLQIVNAEAKDIMQTLLDCYVYAVLSYEGDDSLSDMDIVARYYVEKIPYNLRQDYMLAKQEKAEQMEKGCLSEEAYKRENLYLKLLMVTDFISGMTDSYAQSLSKAIKELKHVM